MARCERHLVDLADVPSAHDDAARVGIGADQVERALNLIDVPAVARRPSAPLCAVHRSEITVLVRPLVPDRDVVLPQIFDVGVAFQEPQKLVDDRAQVQLLRREHREPGIEIEAHLIAEDAERARAGAIVLARAVVADRSEQIQDTASSLPTAATAEPLGGLARHRRSVALLARLPPMREQPQDHARDHHRDGQHHAPS